MEPLKTTLLLIDDHPMLRNGVKQLLNSIGTFAVIGEAGSGNEGIMLAEQLEPDIILLDLNMDDISGLDVLQQLRQKNVSSRVIIFTVSDDKNDIITALKMGADGYLLKDMEPEQFLQSLQNIAEGHSIMDNTISHTILEHLREPQITANQPARDLAILTPRELDIFHLLVKGLANKVIAKKLDIVESTVKVHVKSIFKKLNFKSRMEMTVWFLES